MADEASKELTSATEKLDFNLDELDDNEFDLPAVDSVPTLESILNEPDEDSVLEDEDLAPMQLIHGDSLETSSVSSQESLLTDRAKRRDRLPRSPLEEMHGSILRPSKLKNISAQLLSAADRVDAGMPTAMAVSNLIAIGTSHGLVLVFDPKQVLKWCLGSTVVGTQYGSVSSLSFNRDCTRLLSGFAKGQITMWDLTTGKLLRTITDAHPAGSAVLHVKFTDSFTVAVCSDSGGSVFELEFKRLIGVRTCESRCLFSGSRGEVCIVEPLHMNYTIKDHPMQDVMILAMGTLSKVLLVTLKPQLKVMFTHPLKGDPSTLPLLTWQFVIIQVSERDRVIDPVLAFARDSTIYFYQVVCTNPQDIKCQGLQKMEVPYRLLSIQWMNPRTLVCLDKAEKIHVIDVRSEEELEVIDVSDVELVYGSSHFKSLATGGNVSQALAYAGGQACYQSVISFSGQLFLLGTKNLHVMSLRTWRERIDVLVKQNRYQDALSLALSFYEGRAKAVIGLSGPPQKKRETVSELMLELLFDFVDLAMTQFCPDKGKIQELEEYYQTVVPVCVDYCLHLGRTDILFGRIFERFGMDVIARGTFLECLEPYIMNDKLSSITPAVMKEFVEHYETRGMLDAVEGCIVHLSVASLDIHQIVHLCWNHGLYDAIIYVYNMGMQDFITPLEDLLTILGQAVSTRKQLTDTQIKLGNKLLVYISCCLAGRAYPLGDIPEDIVHDVKEKVFQTITCLHTKQPNEEEPAYPHLRSLLHFDTREFLNVLALAFEEEEFNTQQGMEKRQRIVDILLQVMVESMGFSPTEVGILFTFLARQMARHENTIHVNRVLFEQVLEFLSNPGDESRHEERQQALLELLNAGGLQQFDENRLLHLAENAKFFRVCESLYERRREFDKILSCYLRDSVRKYQAFAYITNIMQSANYSEREKTMLQKQAMAKLQDLVEIDTKQTAEMVITGFATSLPEMVKRLAANRQLQFQFLQGVILCRDASGSAIHVDRQINIDPEVYELYIDLLCQFKQQDVASFVKTAEGYRLEQALQVCRRHKVSDAMAFLLEKAGDVEGAFNIILESLQNKLKSLTELLQDPNRANQDTSVGFGEVQAVLLVIIQLCQRNSNKMDEAGREALWFPLLEAMMSPQRKLKDLIEKHYVDDFKELTHHVLNSMMGYIALPAILQKIMQDPAYNTGKFGEVKELILGMLETYNYEETLMTTCKNLLYHDLHLHLSHLTSVAGRSYIPRQQQCNMCNKHYSNVSDSEAIIVFRCGHSYHTNCLQSVGSVHLLEGEEVWVCYLCSNTKRGRLHSTRFHRALSSTSSSQSTRPKSELNRSKDISLDPQATEAFENFRRSMKTPSRLAILMELSKSGTGTKFGHAKSGSSILQNERFQLRLAPPRFDST